MSDKTLYPGCATGRLLSCTPQPPYRLMGQIAGFFVVCRVDRSTAALALFSVQETSLAPPAVPSLIFLGFQEATVSPQPLSASTLSTIQEVVGGLWSRLSWSQGFTLFPGFSMDSFVMHPPLLLDSRLAALGPWLSSTVHQDFSGLLKRYSGCAPLTFPTFPPPQGLLTGAVETFPLLAAGSTSNCFATSASLDLQLPTLLHCHLIWNSLLWGLVLPILRSITLTRRWTPDTPPFRTRFLSLKAILSPPYSCSFHGRWVVWMYIENHPVQSRQIRFPSSGCT